MKNIITQNPDHIESISFLSTLYIKDKNFKEAINLLDDTLKNNQNDAKLNKLLAIALVAGKDYDRAEVIYKKFLEENPNSSSGYINLAGFYTHTGDVDKAEETLRLLVKNDLDDEDRILTLVKYIKAKKGNDEAIKELKSFVIANNKLGKLRLALAELLMLNGEKEEVVKVLNEVINDFPEENSGILARTTLASLHIRDKNYEMASKVVEEAFWISPNNPKVNFLRARLAIHDKDFEKAIISLRIVIKRIA